MLEFYPVTLSPIQIQVSGNSLRTVCTSCRTGLLEDPALLSADEEGAGAPGKPIMFSRGNEGIGTKYSV